MILMPDLFSFAYVPNWYSQLDMLAEMALPEPWRFKNPIYLTKNPDTPILERYIHAIFKKQLIDYKEERIPSNAERFFHIENEFCCFHTGLYTRRYKAIYACFDRNKKKDSMLEWYFRGFADELSPLLRQISPLPEKPSYYMTQYGVNYNPEWPIRVNVDHILGDEENLSRIPAEIREAQNLPLLLETAVELARRKAVVEPSIVVPQGYQGRVQYLLPICLTDMEQPDLAMTLTIMDGYYLGNTCLTLEMSHFAGRVVKRYGATEKAYQIFMEEADKCNPPLPDKELASIWQSARRFAEKVQSQEGYMSPEDYNDEFCRESLKPADYSDIGQAKVLAKEYGVELRYTAPITFVSAASIGLNPSSRRLGPQRNFWICSLRTQRMTSAGQNRLFWMWALWKMISYPAARRWKRKSAVVRRRPIFPIYPHWHISRL